MALWPYLRDWRIISVLTACRRLHFSCLLCSDGHPSQNLSTFLCFSELTKASEVAGCFGRLCFECLKALLRGLTFIRKFPVTQKLFHFIQTKSRKKSGLLLKMSTCVMYSVHTYAREAINLITVSQLFRVKLYPDDSLTFYCRSLIVNFI